MSLDVYLRDDRPHPAGSGIFVRENGEKREISRSEWDAAFPGREPIVYQGEESTEAFSANITHNLNRMAAEAGIYEHLWRPDEINVTKAAQLIDPLIVAISLMKREPERFQRFNPANGWGSYDVFVPWLERYLNACKENPEASVSVSR